MVKGVSVVALFCLFLIMFSGFAVASGGNENNGIPGLLEQIRDILSNILEKITILVEEGMNITIPDKECQWETYSQITEMDLEGDESSTYISIPENQITGEINVTKVYALFTWSSGPSDRSIIKVNGVECLSKTGNVGDYYMVTLNPGCYYTFEAGLNDLYIDNLENSASDNEIGIKTMWIEMQVKPANC